MVKAKIVKQWRREARIMLNEDERKAACEKIAISMANAGMGWNLDALMKLTAPEIDVARLLQFNERMKEPTPVERGILNRYQDKRMRVRKRKAR